LSRQCKSDSVILIHSPKPLFFKRITRQHQSLNIFAG